MNLVDIADALDNDGFDAVDWDRRQAEIELPELLEVCLPSPADWIVCGWEGIAVGWYRSAVQATLPLAGSRRWPSA